VSPSRRHDLDDRWSEVKGLVDEALDYDSDERQAFVERACAGDLALRAAVESLLQHANRSEGLLARPLFFLDAAVPHLSLQAAGDEDTLTIAQPLDDADRRGTRGVFFWLVVVFGTVFLLLLLPFAVWKVASSGNTVGDFGWSAQRVGDGWRVARVDPSGPAARVLRSDDEVLAFDGDQRARIVGVAPYRRFVQTGGSYTLRISRDGNEEQHTLRLPSVTRSSTVLFAGTYLLLSVCFCAMALVIGLSKSRDPVARLGCLAGCLATLRLLGYGVAPYVGVGRGAALAIDQLAWLFEPCSLALSYHFLYRFSLPTSRERLWSVLNVSIYAVCGAMFLMACPFRLAVLAGREASISLRYDQALLAWIGDLVNRRPSSILLEIFVSASICAVIVRGHHTTRDADQRQRIRWVVAGCLSAFIPMVFMGSSKLLLHAVGAAEVIETRTWRGLDYVADVCFIAVPVSLAYAVAKHRVLGISVVMRRSMQYLLASRVLQGLLLLPAAGLLLPVLKDPNRPLLELFPASALYPNLLLIVALVLSVRYRVQLRGWLDRRFFREAHHRERLLQDTLKRIKDAASVTEVAQLIATTVSAALHPSFICVLSRESPNGPFVLLHASAALPPEIVTLAHAAAARVLVLGVKSSFNVAVPGRRSEVPTPQALVVPAVSRDGRASSVIVLGEKQSDEPYDVADRDLLQATADQIALVHDNLWLSDQLQEEQRIRRDVSPSVSMLWECVKCGACFDAGVGACPRDSGKLAHRLPVERTIAQRYRLERRIGKGGMGTVYEATDIELRRRVAVKVTLGEQLGNRVLRRSQREAQAVARLHHPNIVEVYDFARLSNDGAYLVMELVRGSSWRTEVNARGALSPLTLAGWIDQLLAGLEAAHDAGVVHRDLKPENVLIACPSECIKIVDFGLAVLDAPGTHSQKLTLSGVVMGTPGYMSPEQMRGDPCDERTDLFSLGVMVVEALTGTHPWAEASYDPAVVERLDVLPGAGAAGAALAAVLRRCLAPAAASRYRTVGELREPLLSALRGCEAPLERGEA
jgi:hypothetical protein